MTPAPPDRAPRVYIPQYPEDVSDVIDTLHLKSPRTMYDRHCETVSLSAGSEKICCEHSSAEKDLLRSAARRVCEKDLRSVVANVTHLSSRGPFAQSSRSRALHDFHH